MVTTTLASGRWFLAALASLALSFHSAAFVYSSDKVRIRLVDRDSGMPISSAIGVAVWEVEYPFVLTARVYRPIAVEEALSDSEGWVEFPAWKSERSYKASYTFNAPRILFYHEEYRPTFIANKDISERNFVQPAISRWNGLDVALERSSADIKRQAFELGEINARLPDHRDDPDNPCWFERFPKMLAALSRMDMKFEEAKIFYSTRARAVLGNEAFLVARGCKKPSEVIAGGRKK